jgi:hypothetical protein
MGLDQYIYVTEAKFLKPVDFLPNWAEMPEYKEIGYWRNQRGVQEWMKYLYYAKGGEDADFNGNPVQLTIEDVLSFTKATISTDWTDLEPRRDLEWVPEAIASLQEGKTVYYNSSW